MRAKVSPVLLVYVRKFLWTRTGTIDLVSFDTFSLFGHGRQRSPFFPEGSVPANWYDIRSTIIYDCRVAKPGTEGLVAGNCAHPFMGRILVR